MIWLIIWIANATNKNFWNIPVTDRYKQKSIKLLFLNIIKKKMLHTIIQLHKLINYYWSFCLCSNLNSFRLNCIVLSGILMQYFSMQFFFCWNQIWFSSNPESFQILADEIVNSSNFKSCDITKKCLKIPKGQPQFVYRRTDNTITKRKSTKGKTTIYKTYI